MPNNYNLIVSNTVYSSIISENGPYINFKSFEIKNPTSGDPHSVQFSGLVADNLEQALKAYNDMSEETQAYTIVSEAINSAVVNKNLKTDFGVYPLLIENTLPFDKITSYQFTGKIGSQAFQETYTILVKRNFLLMIFIFNSPTVTEDELKAQISYFGMLVADKLQ
jgi:hypothetical protein